MDTHRDNTLYMYIKHDDSLYRNKTDPIAFSKRFGKQLIVTLWQVTILQTMYKTTKVMPGEFFYFFYGSL